MKDFRADKQSLLGIHKEFVDEIGLFLLCIVHEIIWDKMDEVLSVISIVVWKVSFR